jgi:hypothetical protein
MGHLGALLLVLVILLVLSQVGVFKLIGGVFHVIGFFIFLVLAFLALKFLLFSVALGSIGAFLVLLFVLALAFR